MNPSTPPCLEAFKSAYPSQPFPYGYPGPGYQGYKAPYPPTHPQPDLYAYHQPAYYYPQGHPYPHVMPGMT